MEESQCLNSLKVLFSISDFEKLVSDFAQVFHNMYAKNYGSITSLCREIKTILHFPPDPTMSL